MIELCVACKKEVVGIIDNQLKDEYFGYPVLGSDNDAVDIIKRYRDIPVVITPDNPLTRERLVKYYSGIGFNFSTLIHPMAVISRYARIGDGVVIQNGVNISVNVEITDHVKVNFFANVMHDSKIGRYTTIAPNAVILGRVRVGELCYIGANSTILPDLEISSHTTIGAGAVVVDDIINAGVYVGVPAKEIRHRSKGQEVG